MIWCLNPDCLSPENPDGIERCLSCDREPVGEPLLIQVVGDTRSQYNFKLISD